MLRLKKLFRRPKKHKFIFRSSFDNKKLFTIKFTNEEFEILKTAALAFNLNYQLMFEYIFHDLLSYLDKGNKNVPINNEKL